MSLIEFDNVTKAYYTSRRKDRARIVLNEVSLNFEDNEFVCLVGPSGCGKTTILNMIAGFEMPTLGSVIFKGEKVKKPSPERGVVFQEYSLFPWMSVLKNINLALECKGVPEKERDAISMDALKAVGLSEFANQRPNILSGGMKQRVAIARLFAMDPGVFLMDEPFSALDEQTRRKLDEDLLNIWKSKKKTVVFVTHSVDEAILLSTRIIMFSDSPGTVIREWNLPEDMSRDPLLPETIMLKKEILSVLPVCSCMKRS